MIKKSILGILNKLVLFFNDKIKIKSKSPADFYFEDVSKQSYIFFQKYIENSFVFSNDNSIREFSINQSTKKFDNKNLFLEFGVYKGYSTNLFAKCLKNKKIDIHGFDSFQGLKDEWITDEYNPPGTFNNKKKQPKVESNVKLISGWIEETLEKFLIENNKNIAFIHFDMDTYNSTNFVLKEIKNRLQKGTIILFDEYYGFPNWQKYEYKALKENIDKENFKYIAFGNRQACIEII